MGPLARPEHLVIRDLRGPRDYRATWDAMRALTDGRLEGQPDELWLLEHPPVYTIGQAGRFEHLRDPGGIPVVQSDRGGQVTYHGPGQLIAYVLVDLRRASIGIKRLVLLLEQAVIDLLAGYGVTALARADAPGVYVDGAKIASLGLRVRKGCSYHGLALNLAMDLTPFGRIDPCGYPGLRVTQLADLIPATDPAAVRKGLGQALADALGLRPAWTAEG